MTNNQQINQHQWLRQKQYFLKAIARQIRRSLEFKKILITSVRGIQALLQSDRVFIYSCVTDRLEAFITKQNLDLSSEQYIMDRFIERYLKQYKNNKPCSDRIEIIANIGQINSDCPVLSILQKLELTAQICMPIACYNHQTKKKKYTWGYLIVQEQKKTREWQQHEIGLMEEVALQIAIAVEQARANSAIDDVQSTLENLVTENTRVRSQLSDCQELEIKSSENQIGFAKILEIAEDAIICFDRHQKIILFNQGAEKIFGYSRTQAIGQSLELLLPERFISSHRQYVKKFQKSRETARKMGDRRSNIFGKRKDGSEFPAEVSISKLQFKNKTILTIILRDITVQKQIEQNLREIEARFQAFMNYAPLLSWMVDPDGYVVYGNKLFLTLFNHDRPLKSKTTVWDIFPPNMAESYMEKNQIITTTREVLQTIESKLDADGNVTNYLVCKFPIIQDLGQIWIGGIAIDITEQQKAEDALRDSEEKFRQLADNIHQAFFITSVDGKVLYISAAYEKIWGKSCQSLYENSNSWMLSIHPEDFPRVRAAFQNHLDRGTSFDETYRIFGLNGKLRWVRSRSFPLQDKAGNAIRFTGIAEDITDRKQAEEKIERQYQQGLLLRQITDAIRQNLSTEHIFETTALQIGQVFRSDRCMIHRYVAEPYPQIPLVAEYLNRNYLSLKNIEIPIEGNLHAQTVLEQDRAIVSVDVVEDPLLHSAINLYQQLHIKSMLAIRTSYQQQPNGLICLHQCDTIRQWNEEEIQLLEAIAAQVGIALAQATLLEKEIQQREELTRNNEDLEHAKQAAETANRAKSQFLATMSHEIRTPMNAVLGFTNLLQSSITEPKAKSYVEAIASSGKTLLSLINDILDLSKIEAGKLEINLEPVDLRQLVQDIVQIFQQKADRLGLDLSDRIDETLPTTVLLDEVRIRQTLFNLVGNAIKFTESGSVEIIVNCRKSSPPESDKIGLELSVKDTGIGIAQEHQQKIFETFTQSDSQTTRKYGGTGLGLTITQRLTQLLGGTIDLQSQLGRGSTFTIYFPSVSFCGASNSYSSVLLDDTNLDQFAPMTILVVDDVPSNLDLIAGYFSETHHQLLFAQDGEEAIELTSSYYPDLILLDLRMPRMDGCQAAKFLKQHEEFKKIPIIVVTASSQPQDEAQMKELCEGFVLKPLSQAELVAAIKDIFPVHSQELEIQPSNSDPLSDLVSDRIKLEPNGPTFIETLNLPQLQLKLNRLAETSWLELQDSLTMREVEEFANQLNIWANEHQCQQLLDYARTLQTQLDDFDWNKIPDTVNQFSNLISSL